MVGKQLENKQDGQTCQRMKACAAYSYRSKHMERENNFFDIIWICHNQTRSPIRAFTEEIKND